MKPLLIVCLLICAPAAICGDVNDIGETTRDVLSKQRQGTGAVESRPELKDVAERSYERYLESFTHPIPDVYERGEGFASSN